MYLEIETKIPQLRYKLGIQMLLSNKQGTADLFRDSQNATNKVQVMHIEVLIQ